MQRMYKDDCIAEMTINIIPAGQLSEGLQEVCNLFERLTDVYMADFNVF